MTIVKGMIMKKGMSVKEKRVKLICVLVGILLAGSALSSVNLLPQSWMTFLPCQVALPLIILFSYHGAVHMLENIILFFIRLAEK